MQKVAIDIDILIAIVRNMILNSTWMWWYGRCGTIFNSAEALSEGPDVVIGKAQGLNLGEFCLVGEGGQDQAQLLKGQVEHVHAVPLAVIGLGAAGAAQAKSWVFQRLGKSSDRSA